MSPPSARPELRINEGAIGECARVGKRDRATKQNVQHVAVQNPDHELSFLLRSAGHTNAHFALEERDIDLCFAQHHILQRDAVRPVSDHRIDPVISYAQRGA